MRTVVYLRFPAATHGTWEGVSFFYGYRPILAFLPVPNLRARASPHRMGTMLRLRLLARNLAPGTSRRVMEPGGLVRFQGQTWSKLARRVRNTHENSPHSAFAARNLAAGASARSVGTDGRMRLPAANLGQNSREGVSLGDGHSGLLASPRAKPCRWGVSTGHGRILPYAFPAANLGQKITGGVSLHPGHNVPSAFPRRKPRRGGSRAAKKTLAGRHGPG